MILKPLVRGTVKTTIGVALQVKKLAVEAAEDLQDLAAEASADVTTPKVETQPAPKAGTRSGTVPRTTA
ncbi:MAG: DUF5132 domain-containing protein [Pseudonocardiaceae bacterium]